MFSNVRTACLKGIQGVLIQVETYIGNGIPGFEIVGRAESAIKESRERIKAVFRNCGYEIVNKKITINLAPADIVKRGSQFDLPIAVGILAAMGSIDGDACGLCCEKCLIVGEMSLDGSIRKVRGVMSMVDEAKRSGYTRVIVPADNLYEARLIGGVEAFGFSHIDEVVDFINSGMREYKEPHSDTAEDQGSDMPAYSLYNCALVLSERKNGRATALNGFYTAAYDENTFDSPYVRIEGISDGEMTVTLKKGQPAWPLRTGTDTAETVDGKRFTLTDGEWIEEDSPVPAIAANR